MNCITGTQNLNDLISRQAAIDAIQKDRETGWQDSENDVVYRNACDDGYAYSMQIISELSSVERKKGKWKYEGCDTYSCPFCGDTHVDDGDIYYFCKVCGADMRGEDDE